MSLYTDRGCIWPTQVTTRTRVLFPSTLKIIKYPSLVHSEQIVCMIICKHNDTKNYETFGTNLRALQPHHKIESLEDKLEMIHKSSNHEILKFFGAWFVSSCSHLLCCIFFAVVTMPPQCANECGTWSSTKDFPQLKIAKANCVEIGNAHSQHTLIQKFVFNFFWMTCMSCPSWTHWMQQWDERAVGSGCATCMVLLRSVHKIIFIVLVMARCPYVIVKIWWYTLSIVAYLNVFLCKELCVMRLRLAMHAHEK